MCKYLYYDGFSRGKIDKSSQFASGGTVMYSNDRKKFLILLILDVLEQNTDMDDTAGDIKDP